MENGDKIKIHEAIAVLKTEMLYVKKQVTNHLPTQIKGIDEKFTGKFNWIMGLLVTNLIVIVVGLVFFILPLIK